jgi:hypothetical protein
MITAENQEVQYLFNEETIAGILKRMLKIIGGVVSIAARWPLGFRRSFIMDADFTIGICIKNMCERDDVETQRSLCLNFCRC